MEFKLYCERCGSRIFISNTEVKTKDEISSEIIFKIEVCSTCLEDSRKDGFEEGKEQGYSDGLLAGDK